MGIEPKRTVLPELKNKRFGAMADSKCDQRVNFRGMWGLEGLHRDTSMYEIPGSRLSVGVLRSVKSGASRSRNAIRFAVIRGSS
jgi:hypothetical protein